MDVLFRDIFNGSEELAVFCLDRIGKDRHVQRNGYRGILQALFVPLVLCLNTALRCHDPRNMITLSWVVK